ncbi:MAG: hypothetical protein J2P16_17580 [Mycobacterium sp.]|nr:hypothetical protein [Mycobacterium sp.]
MGAAAGQRRSDRDRHCGTDEHDARNGQPATPIHESALTTPEVTPFSRTALTWSRIGHQPLTNRSPTPRRVVRSFDKS